MSPKLIIASLVAAIALTGCASNLQTRADTAPELVASDVPESGRMHGIVVNRRYGDFFMVDGKEVRREIELAWDYDRGTAVQRTYDTSGKLLQTEDLREAQMRLTPAEDERLHALVLGHPALKDVVNNPDVVIWGGGFLLREAGDRWCDFGSRCVHAIMSTGPGLTVPVAHAIVDLQRDRVVYPFYNASDDAAVGRNASKTTLMGSK